LGKKKSEHPSPKNCGWGVLPEKKKRKRKGNER